MNFLCYKTRDCSDNKIRGNFNSVRELEFKANTDDMREAPSLALIDDLVAAGAKVRAYDPAAAHEAKKVFAQSPAVTIVPHAMDALDGADVLAIVTEWQECRSPDFAAIKK